MRTLLIVHRYLGVAVGLVMALWCLSGFVMMYRGYPAVSAEQRRAGLAPLDLSRLTPRLDLGAEPLGGFRIEMLADRPVLRLAGPLGRRILDLRTGEAVTGVGSAEAAAVASRFAASRGVVLGDVETRLVDQDQWTVEGAASRGPVYRVAFSDPRRTVVYVAQRTGEVVQATDRPARLWAWLGAIPHWLYPHVLRRNGALWAQVVIWTSLVGVFLTATGLYVGIARFRRTRNGRWSPYAGWRWWHHLAGLFFGLFTLTWVTSGLLTMNPWGLLESSASGTAQAALSDEIRAADLQAFLASAARAPPAGAAAIEAAPLGGRLFALERYRNGSVLRRDGQGQPAPLRREELAGALAGAKLPVTDLALLSRPDDYYYPNYDGPAPLPVWRARLAGPGGQVLYLDPISGRIRLAVDGEARASRWIRVGLHDLDFPILRARPVWDLVMILLLAGVTVGVVSGAWLSLNRIALDISRLKMRLNRGKGGAQP
jgi:uncharacterized iron-regulated membrane protein